MSRTISKRRKTATVQSELSRYMAAMKERMRLLLPGVDERTRRLVAAAEARVIGRGGIAAVSRATNMSPRVIAVGLAELEDDGLKKEQSSTRRIRKPGGGRKRLSDTDPTLMQDLEKLVESTTKGDPVKSPRRLAEELQAIGHKISQDTVGSLLQKFGYRSTKAKEFPAAGEPEKSVGTKEKEKNIGQFKNAGKKSHLKPYNRETEELMKAFFGRLSEKGRRQYAAVEAQKLGRGGIEYISELLEISSRTISQGLVDLKESEDPAGERVRKKGGGRKKNLI